MVSKICVRGSRISDSSYWWQLTSCTRLQWVSTIQSSEIWDGRSRNMTEWPAKFSAADLSLVPLLFKYRLALLPLPRQLNVHFLFKLKARKYRNSCLILWKILHMIPNMVVVDNDNNLVESSPEKQSSDHTADNAAVILIYAMRQQALPSSQLVHFFSFTPVSRWGYMRLGWSENIFYSRVPWQIFPADQRASTSPLPSESVSERKWLLGDC